MRCLGSAFFETMSRQRIEPKIYRNQQLMDDFNRLLINVKVHLFQLPEADRFPKPTVQDIDTISNQIFGVLKQDNEPMIKR